MLLFFKVTESITAAIYAYTYIYKSISMFDSVTSVILIVMDQYYNVKTGETLPILTQLLSTSKM